MRRQIGPAMHEQKRVKIVVCTEIRAVVLHIDRVRWYRLLFTTTPQSKCLYFCHLRLAMESQQKVDLKILALTVILLQETKTVHVDFLRPSQCTFRSGDPTGILVRIMMGNLLYNPRVLCREYASGMI